MLGRESFSMAHLASMYCNSLLLPVHLVLALAWRWSTLSLVSSSRSSSTILRAARTLPPFAVTPADLGMCAMNWLYSGGQRANPRAVFTSSLLALGDLSSPMDTAHCSRLPRTGSREIYATYI